MCIVTSKNISFFSPSQVLEGFSLRYRELFIGCCCPGEDGDENKASVRILELILPHSRRHCREATAGEAVTQGLFGVRDDHRLCLPEAHLLFCVYATPGDIDEFQKSGRK